MSKKIGKTLEEHIEFWHKAYNDTFDELQREKEKNKKLKKENEELKKYKNKHSLIKRHYISKDKIKEFYKKYISESLKDFCPYDIDKATPEKERKAGQIRILRLIEKDLLKEYN